MESNLLAIAPTDVLRWGIAVVLLLLQLFILVRLSLNKKSVFRAMLKSHGSLTEADQPYSMSRVQLFWWTMIISACFVVAYAVTGSLKGANGQSIFNSSILLLLGISAGTTVTGRIIDTGHANNPAGIQYQRKKNYKNPLYDIMSDANGISIHRFQAVLFNVIFGFIFIVQFFDTGSSMLPEFDSATLGLLGISSGSYLALKVGEPSTAMNAGMLSQGSFIPPADTPPTDIPPTDMPPTDIPPIDTPPTDIPPTDIPPTDTPPTNIPPTDTPPTNIPPTDTPPIDIPPTDTPPTDIPPTDTPPTPPTNTPPDPATPPTTPS